MWPLVQSRRGACHASTSASEFWEISEGECQLVCATDHACLAFEWGEIAALRHTSFYRRCRTYTSEATSVQTSEEFACRAKPRQVSGVLDQPTNPVCVCVCVCVCMCRAQHPSWRERAAKSCTRCQVSHFFPVYQVWPESVLIFSPGVRHGSETWQRYISARSALAGASPPLLK